MVFKRFAININTTTRVEIQPEAADFCQRGTFWQRFLYFCTSLRYIFISKLYFNHLSIIYTMSNHTESTEKEASLNFIEEIIEEHNKTGRFDNRVHTRFPPEPNGFLHIGHAKSIHLNFGLGEKYHGKTNLRFDDTNPTAEKEDYVNAIKRDVEWLLEGKKWANELYASDYFPQMYAYAVELIKKGKAYVDFSTPDEIAEQKGTPTHAGIGNRYRDTSVDENLALFERMKNGDFADGHCVLRAKIDMASPNMLMRDPIIYRIKHAHHHRTGDAWCIYPMYDFAHCLSDSIEGITQSICSLEFEEHRPLYDWILDELDAYHPQQIEFAKLNITHVLMSKRRLLRLVEGGYVNGWDDPRMHTISALRRRGYTPKAIRDFATVVGVSKRESIIDMSLLEHCVREDLNKTAARVMVVLDPIKVVITNYPEGQTEELVAENNPEDPNGGTRSVPFSREVYIESDDFMENPPKKYFRLAPGQMVRLKNAYIIKCDEVIKDEAGNIVELRCTYVESSKSGSDTSGIHVKGVIHWVSIAHALPIEARLYDRLLTVSSMNEIPADKDFLDYLNPNSLTVQTAYAEASLANAAVGTRFQFMRKGYYCVDSDSTADKKVFNLTVSLKDSWAKEMKKS